MYLFLDLNLRNKMLLGLKSNSVSMHDTDKWNIKLYKEISWLLYVLFHGNVKLFLCSEIGCQTRVTPRCLYWIYWAEM